MFVVRDPIVLAFGICENPLGVEHVYYAVVLLWSQIVACLFLWW